MSYVLCFPYTDSSVLVRVDVLSDPAEIQRVTATLPRGGGLKPPADQDGTRPQDSAAFSHKAVRRAVCGLANIQPSTFPARNRYLLEAFYPRFRGVRPRARDVDVLPFGPDCRGGMGRAGETLRRGALGVPGGDRQGRPVPAGPVVQEGPRRDRLAECRRRGLRPVRHLPRTLSRERRRMSRRPSPAWSGSCSGTAGAPTLAS